MVLLCRRTPKRLLRWSFWNQQPLKRFASSDNNKLIVPAVPSRGDAEELRPPTSFSGVSSIMFDAKVHMNTTPKSWDDYEPETPVGKELMQFILGAGGRPISTAHFMNAANLHPQFGYYVNAKVHRDDDDDDDDDDDGSGTESILVGDFVTAPEISSAFTDCLTVWFYTLSDATKKPYQYVECGPGTGRLITDWLSCTMQLKKPLPTSIHLVEASPKLRQSQRTALETLMKERPELKLEFMEEEEKEPSKIITEPGSTIDLPPTKTTNGKPPVRVYWHNTFVDCKRKKDPDTAVFLVAQEFLDALPVYCFEADKEGRFRERLVDVAVAKELEEEFAEDDASVATKPVAAAEKGGAEAATNSGSADSSKNQKTKIRKPRFRVVLAPAVTPPLKTLLPVDADGHLISKETGERVPVEPGTVVEVSPEAILFCQDVATMLEDVGGAALIVDYGEKVTGDTIRAYRNHKQVPFLSRPGLVDVTADVNFGSLQHVVTTMKKPVSAHGPVTQGQFLTSMGIQERIINMIEREETTDEQANDIYQAFMRLVSLEEMGKRYKVFSIVPGMDAPPGFEDRPSETAANSS